MLNSPADIQASCDLVERAVELHPELVEVRFLNCYLLFVDNVSVSSLLLFVHCRVQCRFSSWVSCLIRQRLKLMR